MRNWKNQDVAVQQVDVLLFDAFSALCLANVIEPLRAANTLAGREVYRWRFLTVGGGAATSSSGMSVAAQGALKDHRGDILMVMPSYAFLRHAGGVTARALRAAAGRYGVMAGLDTGSWLLAEAGLLNGRQATIHWEELGRFSEAFPDVEALRERYVVDRNRITCSGALAAFDLMLEMIGVRHGQALRLEVAALFMSGEGGPQDAPLARGRVVARVVAVMQANLEGPLSIAEIARKMGRSQREIEQRVRQELGATPQAVYRRLRLNLAKKLVLETDLAIAEIALRSGYQDASAMTRAYRAEFGKSPRQMRVLG
jgi:transcriptional regulator GlxA family with amidase domain